MTAHADSIALAGVAARAAAEKLAEDILVIDVSERLAITDCFVIASGDNERQVNAIIDEVEEQLNDEGWKPKRREGRGEGRWVLLDYGDIVVDVQRKEEREFYALDRLWRDAPQIDVEGVEQIDRGPAWDTDELDERDASSAEELPLAGPTPDADEL